MQFRYRIHTMHETTVPRQAIVEGEQAVAETRCVILELTDADDKARGTVTRLLFGADARDALENFAEGDEVMLTVAKADPRPTQSEGA